MKKFFLMMFLMSAFIFGGCNSQAAPARDVKGDLKISMLNVGHGDAILIQTKEQTILIDTALPDKHDVIVKELEKFSVTKIDKLILTHPHGDHIGGAAMLIHPNKKQLNEFPYLQKISVAEVYDNGVVYGSGIYKNYLKAVDASGITHQSLKRGDALDFGDGVKFNVIFPTAQLISEANSGKFDPKVDRQYRLNNTSIVGKLTYKNFSMMFTGDAEKEAEATVLSENAAKDLKCDVLKAGHHGSAASSIKDFVAAVNPECILISTAEKEQEGKVSSGHPHLKVLETYLECGVNPKNIFCTRWNGTITLTSDGQNFSVQPEIKVDWFESWVAGKKADTAKKSRT